MKTGERMKLQIKISFAGGGKIRCTHAPYGLKEMEQIATAFRQILKSESMKEKIKSICDGKIEKVFIDGLKTELNQEIKEELLLLSQYQPKVREDDIFLFNYVYLVSLI